VVRRVLGRLVAGALLGQPGFALLSQPGFALLGQPGFALLSEPGFALLGGFRLSGSDRRAGLWGAGLRGAGRRGADRGGRAAGARAAAAAGARAAAAAGACAAAAAGACAAAAAAATAAAGARSRTVRWGDRVVDQRDRTVARQQPSMDGDGVADRSARIVPTNNELVPSVAELPTCQNTLHGWAPLM